VYDDLKRQHADHDAIRHECTAAAQDAYDIHVTADHLILPKPGNAKWMYVPLADVCAQDVEYLKSSPGRSKLMRLDPVFVRMTRFAQQAQYQEESESDVELTQSDMEEL